MTAATIPGAAGFVATGDFRNGSDDLVVVDKPAGMVVHPGHGVPSGTLVNALLAQCPALAAFEDSLRPGIVHRLDKDTSGVMVVAKTSAAPLVSGLDVRLLA